MKKKNILILTLTVINLIIIALIIGNIMKNEQFSRRKLRQIHNLNFECVNYIANINYYNFKTEYNDTKQIIYKKDRYKEKSEDDVIWYIGNQVYEEKTKEIIELIDFPNKKLGNLSNLYMYIDNDAYEYHYIKTEKIEKTICWVVEFKQGEEKHKFWIEEETGNVLKEEIYNKTEKIEEYQYKITMNKVSDEEVQIPNIEQYHIRENKKTGE